MTFSSLQHLPQDRLPQIRPLTDQAAGLRSIMTRQAPRMIAVVEPREGGARRIAADLASALARQHLQVLFLDEAVPHRLHGVEANGTSEVGPERDMRYRSLGELLAATTDPTPAGFVLLDAQLEEGGLTGLASAAHEIIITVSGQDPTGGAVTAAYASIKNLHARHALSNFRILTVDCDLESRAYGVFCRLATVAARYLTVKLTFAGYLPSRNASPVTLQNAFINVARSMTARVR